MATKDEIKAYFQTGDTPTQSQFAELIDHAFNELKTGSFNNQMQNGDFAFGDVEKRTTTGSFVDLTSSQQQLIDRGYSRALQWGGSSNFAVARFDAPVTNKYFFGAFYIYSANAANMSSEFFSYSREGTTLANPNGRTNGFIQITPQLKLVYGRGQVVSANDDQILIGIGSTPASPSELYATGFYLKTSDTELNEQTELDAFFGFESLRSQTSLIPTSNKASIEVLQTESELQKQKLSGGEVSFGSTQSTGFDFNGRNNSILLPKIPALGRNKPNHTISLWFKLIGTPTTSFHNLFHHSDDAGVGNNLLRYQLRFVTGSGGGIVQYEARGGVGAGLTATLTNQLGVQTKRGGLNDGSWHHCVAILENGAERLIIDGCEDNEDLTANLGGSPADGGEIGYNRGASQVSWHAEADVRVYPRVLTSDEVITLMNEGPDSKATAVSGYQVRYVGSEDNAVVADISGNGHDASWLAYDAKVVQRIDYPKNPNRLRHWYCLGNSLTIDADMPNVAPIVDLCINNNEGMRYHVAHPNDSKNNRTRFWSEALANTNYDVLCMQPFQEDGGDEGWSLQNINAEESNFQHFIDLQSQLKMILIYQAFPTSATISNAGYDYEQALGSGDFAYSRAYYDELHRRLAVDNPGIEIRQIRSAEAMALLKIRIAEGGSPFASIGSMYRDGIHMGYSFGRWFAHNCVRRSVGLPFSSYGIFNLNSAGNILVGLEPTEIRYLQNVINEVM